MNTTTYDTIWSYVDRNPIATLGTTDENNLPQGAVVYVCADDEKHVIYFITKQATQKYHNLIEHPDVSLTIVNPGENNTLQANGHAVEIEDAYTIDMVMRKIAHDHVSAKEWLPPIAKLRAGAYAVVGITLTYARLAQFNGMAIGDERIFTEL